MRSKKGSYFIHRRGRIAICCLIGMLYLCSCTFSTKKMNDRLKEGIALLDEGEYTQSIIKFDEALEMGDIGSISALELTILKYRAEAEFKAEDYVASAYTYGLLMIYDREETHYMDMYVICLAKQVIEGADVDLLEEALEYFEEAGGIEASALSDEIHKQAVYALADTYVWLDVHEGSEEGSELAKSYYEALLAVSQRADSKALIGLGNLFIQVEDYQKALAYYEEAIDTLGKDSIDEELLRRAKYAQAICYEYMGDYAQALELFSTYVEVYGTEDEVQHEIDFLTSRIR